MTLLLNYCASSTKYFTAFFLVIGASWCCAFFILCPEILVDNKTFTASASGKSVS